jgi:NADPH:quinone reductase-like Zn-dependent oxidoreductase
MRAIVITEPGGPEVLQIQEVADPVPGRGEILIRVRAFGVNHAETHMRKGRGWFPPWAARVQPSPLALTTRVLWPCLVDANRAGDGLAAAASPTPA